MAICLVGAWKIDVDTNTSSLSEIASATWKISWPFKWHHQMPRIGPPAIASARCPPNGAARGDPRIGAVSAAVSGHVAGAIRDAKNLLRTDQTL